MIGMNGSAQRKSISMTKPESDAFLRTFVNSIPEPAMLIDRVKKILFANEAVLNQFSKPGSQIIGQSILEVLTPEQGEQFQQHFNKAMQTKNPINFKSKIGDHPIINFLLPVFDGEVFDCLVFLGIDDAEQTNSKFAWLTDDSRYQSILESSPVGFISHDEKGTCIYTNNRFAEMLGRVPSEIIGLPLTAFIDPKHVPVYEQQSEKLKRGGGETFDIAWVTKTGQHLTTIFSPRSFHDKSGNYTGGVAILTDITERIEASQKARQQLAMLQALYTGAQELSKSLELMDLSNRMVKSCVDTFGVKLAWLGQAKSDGSVSLITSYPVNNTYPQQITVRWDEAPEGLDASGQAIQKSEPVILNDLSSTSEFGPWYELAKSAGFCSHASFPLVSHERSFGVLSLFSDQAYYFTSERVNFFQTYAHQAAAALENARLYQQVQGYAEDLEGDYAERTNELQQRVAEVEELNKALALLLEDFQASNIKLAETTKKLQAANAELESFSYSVSHDLKAPLRGIDGYSRLLFDEYHEKLDDEGRMFLESIRKGAQQMSQLIDDLLAYSRMERRSITSTIINPRKLIEALLGQREHEIKERGIQITIEEMCDKVQTDSESLSQALRNLIDNAIKFTRGVNDPKITLGGYKTESTCVLWVRDNGIGFDMQFHDRIYDIFQRLHTNDTFPGTGVGLAIVRKAMQHMGGRVWAESAPGMGATFFLEIPLSMKIKDKID
jgi:PAS domain S-box-containing protein